ncbi:DUF2887 domain-containing protein [bacterium]|nr:DUF2887 domain-containing protein [bacterium]
MKTDSLFYELFQFDPQSLLRLVHLKVQGQYTFESITIKTTEKRLDGFFKNVDGKGPNIFLEVQGYLDPKIYWRLFREICAYYEQKEDTASFVAIVLFLDRKYDPGIPPLFSGIPPHQLIRVNLIDSLKTVEDKPGVLTILKPLVVLSKKELVEAVPKWKADIQSLKLPKDKTKILIELLEYAVIQRFPKLSLKEVQTMLQLTPLEQTVAGQELIQIGLAQGLGQGMEKGLEQGREQGREQGLKKGMEKGRLIGEIQMAQRILKYPIASEKELAQKKMEELNMIFQQLDSELT